MADVVRLLGVELEEEFKIKDTRDWTYKFIETGLMCRNDRKGNVYTVNDTALFELLKGEREIIKLPWKPGYGEDFYFYTSACNGGNWKVSCWTWDDTPIKLALLKLGLVYRTREECEAHLKEDYKKLTGKEWEE